jgi:hypothetical protein
MKESGWLLIFTVVLFWSLTSSAQITVSPSIHVTEDKVQALKDSLLEMTKQTDNALFVNSCQWFIQVMDAQPILTYHDSTALSAAYDTFCINSEIGNCRDFSTYLNRERPLTIAWESPTDGTLSFAELYLPKDWNPEATYPLYIHLHGLSNTTHLPIDFLTRYFLRDANSSYGYEDGYYLLPWGRGNLWYQGISETDILECKEAFEQMVKIDPQRQYLKGHSMGGYGAWLIASHTPDIWAAIGIEAGALWYGNNNQLDNAVIQQLKDMPTYFVTGTQDGLLGINEQAYNLLVAAGNTNTEFVTFEGGHERTDANEELLYLWIKEFVKDGNTPVFSKTGRAAGQVQSHPNPFNRNTSLSFVIQKKSFVNISILTADGKLVETIVNKTMPQGLQKIEFYPVNLRCGIYFCRFQIDGNQVLYSKLVKID